MARKEEEEDDGGRASWQTSHGHNARNRILPPIEANWALKLGFFSPFVFLLFFQGNTIRIKTQGFVHLREPPTKNVALPTFQAQES